MKAPCNRGSEFLIPTCTPPHFKLPHSPAALQALPAALEALPAAPPAALHTRLLPSRLCPLPYLYVRRIEQPEGFQSTRPSTCGEPGARAVRTTMRMRESK